MQIGGHDSRIYQNQNLTACPNCNRRFPPDNIDIHQAYCARNFRKCQMCGAMVDKNSIEQHNKQMHSPKVCQYCSKECVGRQLLVHMEKCNAKPQPCPFCTKLCPRGQLKSHQQTCALRFKQCSHCKKKIPIKQYPSHQQRCEGLQLQRRQNSQQQRNQNSQQQNPRQLFRQNSENQLNIGSKRKNSSNQHVNEGKKNTNASKNVIQREHIKQQVSPIPISIQVTIKQKKQAANLQAGK